MKKILCFLLIFVASVSLVACGNSAKEIELMGAGDRIHDTYTFANVGTKIKNDGENKYTIYGFVEKLDNDAVKNEFNIDEDVNHVVAIKLMSMSQDVNKDEVEIKINGSKNYDAEHLNGSNYTFIILEAKQDLMVTISVKWNKNSDEINYVIYFANDIILK